MTKTEAETGILKLALLTSGACCRAENIDLYPYLGAYGSNRSAIARRDLIWAIKGWLQVELERKRVGMVWFQVELEQGWGEGSSSCFRSSKWCFECFRVGRMWLRPLRVWAQEASSHVGCCFAWFRLAFATSWVETWALFRVLLERSPMLHLSSMCSNRAWSNLSALQMLWSFLRSDP